MSTHTRSIVYLADIRLPTEKAHGIHIMTMCDAFAQAGFKVELVVPRRKNTITQDPYMYYGVSRSFAIRKLASPNLRSLPIIGHVVSLVLFYMYAFFAINRVEADTIYSRDIVAGIFFKRCILELHVLPRRIGVWYQSVLSRARGIVVLNTYARDQLTTSGISSDRILIAPDAVSLERFTKHTLSREETRAHMGVPDGAQSIVYTGHLYAWKGVDTLASAMALLPESFHLFCIGGMESDIVRFKQRYGADKRIHLLGARPHHEMPDYLQAADLVVLPNTMRNRVASHYTSPMKLFEYMAARIPIVASDVPAIREIVDERSVFFFKPDDPDDLASVIQQVFQNPEEARLRADHAYHVVHEYTWQRRVQRIQTLFGL